jgi:hypothetical protein
MTDKAISPLRQRMIEDMTIRKLAPKTQHDYVQRVKNFAAFKRKEATFVRAGDVWCERLITGDCNSYRVRWLSPERCSSSIVERIRDKRNQ